MPATTQTINNDLQELWKQPQLFTTTLMAMLIDSYGLEALNWLPETVQMEIEEDYGVDLPYDNFAKIMVGMALMTTNSFFVSEADFAHFCVVLSGHHVPPGTMILPDSDDCAWGINEGMLLSDYDDDKKNENPFSPEITGLIGHVLDEEGIIVPPDVLRIATRGDEELTSRVDTEFSDDPTMFNAIWDMERGKTDYINALMHGRMKGLLTQLWTIPLKHRETEKFTQFAEKAMESLKPGDEYNLVPDDPFMIEG